MRTCVEDLKGYQRIFTRSWGAEFGVQAREGIPGYVMEIIRESHFPTTNKGDVTDAQVFKGPTDEVDLGLLKVDLGDSLIGGVQRAVQMSRSGDACQRVQQVKTRTFSFLHENGWAGKLKTEERSWKRGVGGRISRALIQGLWPEDFRLRVERQVDLKKAGHDPSEVLKAMRELSKEQATGEDDRRSARKRGRPSHMGAGKSDGADRPTREKPSDYSI